MGTKLDQFREKVASGTDEELQGALQLAQAQIDDILDAEDSGNMKARDESDYYTLCTVRQAVVAELHNRGLQAAL